MGMTSVSEALYSSTTVKSSKFNLDAAIDKISEWLPTQGPIKDFIAQNILQTLEGVPFHEGLALASRVYGASSYLPLKDYRTRYENGRINGFAIDWAIRNSGIDPSQHDAIRSSLFSDDESSHLPPPSLASHGLRNQWLTHIEVNINTLAPPVLFRLVGNFLDQGISKWTVAREGESFWLCLRRLVSNSFVSLHPFDQPGSRLLLNQSVDEAILVGLEQIVGSEDLYEQYLLEMLLIHPGWSGMVRAIETNPQSLVMPRIISLKELIAAELAIELGFLSKKRGNHFERVIDVPKIESVARLDQISQNIEVPLVLKIWHEAMEYSQHSELLHALRKQELSITRVPAEIQAIFCIDDRECSIRRHLEEVNPNIKTYGAAGFFGIDFLYRGVNATYAVAQCPAVIKPNHVVVESRPMSHQDKKPGLTSKLDRYKLDRSSIMHGWLFTQTLGVGYAARLAWDVFRPGSSLLKISKLSEVDEDSNLHLLRVGDERTEDGRMLGFSHAEMADRIQGFLRNIGLTDGFSNIVYVIAHGSTSVNNPHYAAYDCGACSGRPGAPNARAFAWMANDTTVRSILRERGIDIPGSTRFIPALHNTTRDDITYFDRKSWVRHNPLVVKIFQDSMKEALDRNAQERCRFFELGPGSDDKKASHDHVRARSASIFEPRPEYTHSNNLYCVVGRRDITTNLYMDRRAFLHSYEPQSDSEGSILLNILNAVIPVCGGINLCYLLSKIDNSIYGAGTKLPHNVIGLLGVANGVEGDLRTGLPSQMVEIHEPARMMFVIEQSTTIIDKSIARLAHLKRTLDNQWVKLSSYDPSTREIKLYSKQGWLEFDYPESMSVPSAPSSQDIFVGCTEIIPVHLLVKRAQI